MDGQKARHGRQAASLATDEGARRACRCPALPVRFDSLGSVGVRRSLQVLLSSRGERDLRRDGDGGSSREYDYVVAAARPRKLAREEQRYTKIGYITESKKKKKRRKEEKRGKYKKKNGKRQSSGDRQDAGNPCKTEESLFFTVCISSASPASPRRTDPTIRKLAHARPHPIRPQARGSAAPLAMPWDVCRAVTAWPVGAAGGTPSRCTMRRGGGEDGCDGRGW